MDENKKLSIYVMLITNKYFIQILKKLQKMDGLLYNVIFDGIGRNLAYAWSEFQTVEYITVPARVFQWMNIDKILFNLSFRWRGG